VGPAVHAHPGLPAPEVGEDPAHQGWGIDQRNDAHRAFTLLAFEPVGFIHLPDQLLPCGLRCANALGFGDISSKCTKITLIYSKAY
jgi:hypothetical protein